jgi:AcrR family transcriptional regulator
LRRRVGENSVLKVQNAVPAKIIPIEAAIADEALRERRSAYVAEVRALIDAAFAVMARTGDIDPPVRDIVREAGLSNQAFYRHFTSKDVLLLAVLTDGQRQLIEYLRHRVARASDPREQVRRWIDGIMAQARDKAAADATRPFAVNGTRLAARFPAELAATRAELLETLTPAVRALGGTEHDAELVRDLALGRMNDAIAARRTVTSREVSDLVDFCLDGLRRHR